MCKVGKGDLRDSPPAWISSKYFFLSVDEVLEHCIKQFFSHMMWILCEMQSTNHQSSSLCLFSRKLVFVCVCDFVVSVLLDW